MDVRKLILDKKYEEILKLDSPLYDEYKCVASIYLNNLDDALKYAKKNSFNEAYVYYRRKNFKKCLKKIKGRMEYKFLLLKTQCLYFLGHYKSAYDLFVKIQENEMVDEFVVNLTAMESLGSISDHLGFRESKYVIKKADVKLEQQYNKLFSCIDNEMKYLELLNGLNDTFPVENSVVQKQLNFITDKFQLNNLTSNYQRNLFKYNHGTDCKVNFHQFQDNVDIKNKIYKGNTENIIGKENRLVLLYKAYTAFNKKDNLKVKKILEKHSGVLKSEDKMILTALLNNDRELGMKILGKK